MVSQSMIFFLHFVFEEVESGFVVREVDVDSLLETSGGYTSWEFLMNFNWGRFLFIEQEFIKLMVFYRKKLKIFY